MTKPMLGIVLMTGALSGQEPAGAPGSWEWVAVREHPERRFRLFVPERLAADAPAPLVVMLHGCTQDPDDFARGSRFNLEAARRGVVVAYPEQPAGRNPQKCWNWFFPAHQTRGAGEPELVAAVARQVMATRPIDPARVYVGGVSAGGSMAQYVGAAYPDLFAAVGAHSAVPIGAAHDVPSALAAMRGQPLAMAGLVSAAMREAMHGPLPAFFGMQGEADAVVTPVNLAACYVAWTGGHGAGVARDDSLRLGGRAAVRTRHVQADGRYPVEVWRVEGLGHAWSGGSSEGTYADPAGPDASVLMLDFFLSHPRGSGGTRGG